MPGKTEVVMLDKGKHSEDPAENVTSLSTEGLYDLAGSCMLDQLSSPGGLQDQSRLKHVTVICSGGSDSID